MPASAIRALAHGKWPVQRTTVFPLSHATQLHVDLSSDAVEQSPTMEGNGTYQLE
jgi:hypothetical protein